MKNVFGLLIIALAAILVFAACGSKSSGDPTGGPCTDHSWGAWVATVPATCVTTGEGARSCIHCGAVDTNTTIPIIPASHSFTPYWEIKPGTLGFHVNSSPACTIGTEVLVCDCPSAGSTRPTSRACQGTAGLNYSAPGIVGIHPETFNVAHLCFPENAPEAATSIDMSAFNNNKNILSVRGGAKLLEIGIGAFRSCANLTSVSFPNVTDIGNNAFHSCASLSSVSFPAAESIGGSAFLRCNSLKSVEFPELTSINGYTFEECKSLESVYIPKAAGIGSRAFFICSKLTAASFPAAITIGDDAFKECTSLKSASFPSANIIEAGAFHFCSSLETAYFPASASIGSGAFEGCITLKDVTLGAITDADFSELYCFPGDLRDKYFEAGGGPGRYTRVPPSDEWTKQP